MTRKDPLCEVILIAVYVLTACGIVQNVLLQRAHTHINELEESQSIAEYRMDQLQSLEQRVKDQRMVLGEFQNWRVKITNVSRGGWWAMKQEILREVDE